MCLREYLFIFLSSCAILVFIRGGGINPSNNHKGGNMSFHCSMRFKHWFYHPAVIFLLGGALGGLSVFLDRYTQNLGNIFSQFGIWILLGVCLVYVAPNCRLACLDCFLGSVGMVLFYYGIPWLQQQRVSTVFVIGWALFALFSPFLAFLTWQTRRRGVIATLLSLAIILFSLVCAIVLFDGPRWYDVVICLLLAGVLFLPKKSNR